MYSTLQVSPRHTFLHIFDLLRRHTAGAGNLPVEIIALRGAHGVDADTGLRKAGSPPGMGMDDAADRGVGAVELQMRRRVG